MESPARLAGNQWNRTETYGRIALFGGVYNNYLALDRLLKKCEQRGVDAIFCLGDMGGFGPYPDRCFPYLRDGRVLSIAGNYDVSIAARREDCGCGYTDPRDNHFAKLSYDYTFRNISDENREWLGSLPRLARFRLGSFRIYLCHGSPRQTNEFLWESASPDHLLWKFTQDLEADVICCTHTGIKWHRALAENRHFVNVGVIGRPENDGATHVWFTLLECGGDGLRCEFVPLEYDYRKLAREMEKEDLPREFIETVLTGWWTTCLEVMPGKERLRGKY
ncbi:MAG: metallophosphoesterase family protein [Acidobacteriota bacterium]